MGASRQCASGCKPSEGNFCGIGEDCPPGFNESLDLEEVTEDQ